MMIRAATAGDNEAIWKILEPVIRAGDTYTLSAEKNREDALAYWGSPGHEVFVAEESGEILGTYYLRANQKGRSTRCELRIHDGAVGQRTRHCAGDVPAFPGAREGARLPRDAVQFRREQQRACGAALAEHGI